MTEFRISSIPMLHVIQKACEVLVVHNSCILNSEHDLNQRSELTNEMELAEYLINNLREIIKNNDDV